MAVLASPVLYLWPVYSFTFIAERVFEPLHLGQVETEDFLFDLAGSLLSSATANDDVVGVMICVKGGAVLSFLHAVHCLLDSHAVSFDVSSLLE